MSSIEDWQRQYGEVLQKGDPDLGAALNKLDLGERNVVRARRDLEADDPDDSALITGAHQARFDYPRLPGEFAKFKAQLLMARRMRSQAIYDIFGMVSGEQANAATDAAEKLLSPVRRTFPG